MLLQTVITGDGVPGIHWGEIITVLVNLWGPALLSAAVALLTVGIKAAWSTIQAWIKTHLDDKQQALLADIAEKAVFAAEQIARRDDFQNAAKQKKLLAERFVNEKLASYGISLTSLEIEHMIEAAVAENGWALKDIAAKPEPVPPHAAPTTTPLLPGDTITVKSGALPNITYTNQT